MSPRTPRNTALLQEGKKYCSACDSVKKLTEFHLHKFKSGTGDVRGSLCTAGNHGLGFFKDDPSNLSLAIKYLAKTVGVPA